MTVKVNIHLNLNLNLPKKFQRRVRTATTDVALHRHLPNLKAAQENAPWIDVNARLLGTDDASRHHEGENLHHEGENLHYEEENLHHEEENLHHEEENLHHEDVNFLLEGSTPLHEEETTPHARVLRAEVGNHRVTRVAADRLPKTTPEDDVKRRGRQPNNRNGKGRYLLNHLQRNEQEVLLLKLNHARFHLHLARTHLKNLKRKRKLKKAAVHPAQHQKDLPLPNQSSLLHPEKNRWRRPHLEKKGERNPRTVVKIQATICLLVVENKEMNLLKTVAKKCARNRLQTVENNDKIPLKSAKNNATIRQMSARNNERNRRRCVKSAMLRQNVV